MYAWPVWRIRWIGSKVLWTVANKPFNRHLYVQNGFHNEFPHLISKHRARIRVWRPGTSGFWVLQTSALHFPGKWQLGVPLQTRSPGASVVPASIEPHITVEAPSVSALMMWLEFWTPPSAMMGTPREAAYLATWYTAVAWPRPTAHTCRGPTRGQIKH